MKRLLVLGGLLAVVLAAIVSAYASPAPDGLQKVALDHGFAVTGQESATAGSPVAGYSVSGLGQERMGTAVAGLTGLAVTAAVGFGLFHLLKRRQH